MAEDIFEAVDHYIEKLFVPDDPVLTSVLKSSIEQGMPDIQVSPSQGKFLYLLVKLIKARRILELGTLAGYSTIWMARALPSDGKLISLEAEPMHAQIAAKNIARAHLTSKVEIISGPALNSLPQLELRHEEPFDFVFLDADKENFSAYLDWSLKLTKSGSLIAADNVIREGTVLKKNASSSLVLGARAFNETLAANSRLESVIIQQVGIKGHDGLALAIVK